MFVAGKLFQKAGEGSGGGDKHNKGYFVDESALTTAYPTAEAGDYAIVESTDTVWIWDSDNQEWVDSDQKGQVTSVNGQTGDVVINTLENKATGTNALCVSNDPTGYPSSATAKGSLTYGGNNRASGANAVAVGNSCTASGVRSIAYGYGMNNSGSESILIGAGEQGVQWTNNDSHTFKVVLGDRMTTVINSNGQVPRNTLSYAVQHYSTMPTAASTNEGQIVQFTGTTDANYTHGYIYESIATTTASSATASQITGSGLTDIAIDTTLFDVYAEGEFGLIDYTCVFEYSNGIWTGIWGDEHADLSTIGITFTGTPVDGDVIEVVYTAESTSYSWTRTDVQPAGATYTAGNGISIDANNEISVADPVLVNKATASNGITIYGTPVTGSSTGINIGKNSVAGLDAFALGYGAAANGQNSIAIGPLNTASVDGAVQIGGIRCVNSEYNTVCFGNANGNFKFMNNDGTVPHERLTNAVVPNVVTIAVADWNSGTTCTKTVSGLTATSVVWVAPDNASQSDYLTAGVYASAQTADTITFTCTTTPTSSLTVNVIYC